MLLKLLDERKASAYGLPCADTSEEALLDLLVKERKWTEREAHYYLTAALEQGVYAKQQQDNVLKVKEQKGRSEGEGGKNV